MKKFYELSTKERLEKLYQQGYLSASDLQLLQPSVALSTDVASHMIENQIGDFPVPLGLAENFVIDGQNYLIPMAVEEPSVIAAASNAAKRIAKSGGFKTEVIRKGVNSQIVFWGNLAEQQTFLDQHLMDIKQITHAAHPSLYRRGGGLRKVTVNNIGEYTEFNLLIDPKDAMGANVINTISEAVSQYLQKQLSKLHFLMAILSNKADNEFAISKVAIGFDQLATKTMAGQQVAQRIVQATEFAKLSPYRAATHNKGIMNGINALVLASGNDTRNINAAAYAELNQADPIFTDWQIKDNRLCGRIKISLPLGSVGGAISVLPIAKLVQRILKNPDAKTLMGIVASVGLASNLSALRALVTNGIQAGHMKLQIQSLAIMAGAKDNEIDTVVSTLEQDIKHANLERAKEIVKELRKNR